MYFSSYILSQFLIQLTNSSVIQQIQLNITLGLFPRQGENKARKYIIE